MDAKDFGKIVKERRVDLGISQKELANQLFVSEKTISSWECGRNYPSIEDVKKLSSVLDIDLFSMFNETELPIKNKWSFVKYIILAFNILSVGFLFVPIDWAFVQQLTGFGMHLSIPSYIIIALEIVLLILSTLDIFHYGRYFIYKSYVYIVLSIMIVAFTRHIGYFTVFSALLISSCFYLELFSTNYDRCRFHKVVVPSIAIFFVTILATLALFVLAFGRYKLTILAMIFIDFLIPVGSIWYLYYKKVSPLKITIIIASVLTTIFIIGVVLLFAADWMPTYLFILIIGSLGIFFSPIFAIFKDHKITLMV